MSISLASFIIVLMIQQQQTCATLDMNLSELQYIADHLTSEECRKLAASLHFQSYELNAGAWSQAEVRISKDIPCIHLLLHWNSQKGEGKGQTHQLIEHRLRQMDKIDLADWLGKSVFQQLANDLQQSVNQPFDGIPKTNVNPRNLAPFPTIFPIITNRDLREWSAFDSICWVLILGLAVAITCLLIKVCCFASSATASKERLSN